MKKILVLTTGGTIASVPTEQGLQPGDGNVMLNMLGSISSHVQVDVKEIMSLDSTNIQPEEWRIIATEIFGGFGVYDGIVVTHGTDTMAYTASMMTFMLKNPPVPVVFTGSQVPLSYPLTDALFNLKSAISMAASGIRGVFIAFDRKIILGCRSVKVRTTAFNAFESVNWPYIANIDSAGLVFNEQALPHYTGEPELDSEINPAVFLLKLTPGTNPAIIDAVLETGTKAIVIEAFGAGGIQFIRRDFISKLAIARQKNIPVVVCSQCLYESANFSIYQVGQKALEEGAIQGYDMTTEAAVTKLMWALGHKRSIEEVRQIFETSIAGEVTFPK